MKMKQLLRYMTSWLRTALLLGAIAFVNIPQVQAQTAEQWAEMPDAFETMDPASIIGNGEYYYIQFYHTPGYKTAYLTDCGVNKIAKAKDFLPYAYNRQWTLESANDGNAKHFKLKNKAGHYLCFGTFENKERVGCVDNSTAASTLIFHSLGGDGYDISSINNENRPMYRPSYGEWTDLAYNTDKNSGIYDVFRLRFAKLKSTAAFIIYYRGEASGDAGNTDPTLATTRHYLTYSGTGNESPTRDQYFRETTVSTRQSIIPSDKPLWTLPTLAAYHQDGLWKLEGTGNDGQFYIKKYGNTDEYLNLAQFGSDGFKTGVLGAKDDLYGKYTLKDRDANRYSLIQNVKYAATNMGNIFQVWDRSDALASSTGTANATFNVGNGTTFNPGDLVAGTGDVQYLTYADLTNYSKMVISGTEGMQLRVLLNRQESNSGPYVERTVTIGNDGTAVVDLSKTTVGRASVNMTYVNGNDDAVNTSYGEVTTAVGGYNKFVENGTQIDLGNKSWGVNNLIYLKVDASAISGTISKVKLKAKVSGSTDNRRTTNWGVGYNSSDWSSNLTWNTANKSITTIGTEVWTATKNAETYEDKEFDITQAFSGDNDKIVTILVYELAAAGGNFKDPVVEVEYVPDTNSYTHLNAIKTGWNSPSGTINSISLLSENTGDTHYLHHAKGDGWQLMEWTGTDNNYFYAGFYPVEVPVPNKDEFFQVLLQLKSNNAQMVDYNGGAIDYSEDPATRKLFQLEQVENYLQFRLKTPTGQYLKPYPYPGGVTDPNDPTGADIISNIQLVNEKFNLKWFYVDPEVIAKEIPVDGWVKHKISYLKDYVDDQDLDQRDLTEQGLSTNADSEWKNFTDNPEVFTQKVNHFVITHYVKKNNTRVVLFPTVLRTNNDHVYYQRFYNYDEVDIPGIPMDLENLKAHVSLDDRDDGNVQYFLYNNGIVTGEKLPLNDQGQYQFGIDWTGIEDGGMERKEKRRFNYTNSDGKAFTVAVDVSRYSDLEYVNTTDHLAGDLIEPSLTMRYIYNMKDAKEMAAKLTACQGNKWLESKDIHFPAKRISYELNKLEGYQGEFLSLYHLFRDYWVFDDPNYETNYSESELDDHLVHAVIGNNSGRIQIVLENNNADITLGGHKENNVAQGYYLYDEAYNNSQNYGDSRFMVFNYPSDGVVTKPNENTPATADLCAYFVDDNNRRYNLCKYHIIFDTEVDSETKAWHNVESTSRDPKNLRNMAGDPIAKISFDYPNRSVSNPNHNFYHIPPKSDGTGYRTKHNLGVLPRWENQKENENDPDNWVLVDYLADSSPIPLPFGKTNYAFDGKDCSWGSYALISKSTTPYGYNNKVEPSNTSKNAGDASNTLGYGIGPDDGMQDGFLYIDASEQPGDICSISFQGDFCASDKLICSGWISGANMVNPGEQEKRCPGGITLTMKGENDDGSTVTIYRFCPGQCYELNSTYNSSDNKWVEWQQFYFEFSTDKKYKRYWMEVNNNCVSSNGGDFMLDNIEIFAKVPEVIPGVNTPLCVSTDDDGNVVTDMRLLKLSVNFNKLRSSANVSDHPTVLPELGFVFLEKNTFLKNFRTGLQNLTDTERHTYHLDDFDFSTISLDDLAKAIEEGRLGLIPGNHTAYSTAFDKAILGEKTTWYSKNPTDKMKSSVLYFQWNPDPAFNDDVHMPVYSFADAVNRTSPVYREEVDGEKYVVFNGNYPALNWKTNTDYYIIISNEPFESGKPFVVFNLCSECTKASVFQIEPPFELLGLEKSEDTNDYVVCEGQIPTLLTDLKGYDLNGNEVPMQDLNFDWWLGDPAHGVLATLTNYHNQEKYGYKLDEALPTLRIYYPDATDLDGIIGDLKISPNPELKEEMVRYLKELVEARQLVLHQKSISLPAVPAGTEDPYFYLVACPIHDAVFDQTLNPRKVTVIRNGSMEGYDVSSFFMGDPKTSDKRPATITTGIGKDGSRGIRITSSDNPATESSDDYDTQFFIRSNEVLHVGTKFHLEFDYKASAAATIATQAHSEPGNYNHYDCIGYVNFTTEWQHFSQDITVTDLMGNGVDDNKNNSFQTIAFNLWKGSSNTYYFDNVDFYVYSDNKYVAYFCDEPQGLRVKVGEKAPTLKTGFVPSENGFSQYNYPTDSDPVLSIRLAKKAQFMEVQHGTMLEAPVAPTDANGPLAAEADQLHYLWLPIRDAMTQTAVGVIRKAEDYNIYLASTNDPEMDKVIYKTMKKGSLPIVGKIVQLYAINTTGGSNIQAQNDNNRLCIYFTENFEVREGYQYTLTLPFQEVGDVNSCDGTILINVKIVPDYEVWTGATGNTDWNNDENWRRADGNSNIVLNAADELYVGAAEDSSPLKGYKSNDWNYRTDKDRLFRKGFAPLYCTHILIKSDEWGKAPELYDAIDGGSGNGNTGLLKSPFPNLRDWDGWDGTTGDNSTPATATPILRYDMQARLYDKWPETYGDDVYPNKGRAGDLIAEMYQINSCDEIVFQPGTEMLNAHLLNYNNAWVEYKLDNKRWYLLGSPLQGTISGEWYAPTGTAKQKTTYYDDVTFGAGYDRYSPAIYQRSWDKAKAVLYEVGSTYSTDDDKQDTNLGKAWEGVWSGTIWQDPSGETDGSGADEYLDRLGYKPMSGNKANVAIKGVWSNTYNDATVNYAVGGFSVMVMNHLKPENPDQSGGNSIIRLPKEDIVYNYYKYSQTGASTLPQDGQTNTKLDDVQTVLNRAKNRGRLKTDLLLPASTVKTEASTSKYQVKYGERTYTRIPIKEAELTAMNATFVEQDVEHPATAGFFQETVSAGISDLGFYLLENPFPCGLNMNEFFKANEGLQKQYWLLTETGQHLVQKAADSNEWISSNGTVFATANAVLAPGQGFFVETVAPATPPAEPVKSINITFNREMLVRSRYGVESGTPKTFTIVVGQNQKMEDLLDDNNQPVYIEVDYNKNGIYGETLNPAITIDGVEKTVEREVVRVPVFEKDNNGDYVLDADGNKIPVLDTPITQDVTIYNYEQTSDADYKYPLKARTRGGAMSLPGLVITAQRGNDQSNALVMQREQASNDFLPSEDTEVFITSDLEHVPTVYTLCGRLATTINSIHDFRSLPLGVESNSNAPCTLTFQGVEMLGDSIAFYDALERKLTPLKSGMTVSVSGQTQNRYYLVRSLIQEEAAAETHLQIFTQGLTAKVIASTAEPITSVRCYDTSGRLIHSATPQTSEYSFTLPTAGIYIIDAGTDNDHKTVKVMVK